MTLGATMMLAPRVAVLILRSDDDLGQGREQQDGQARRDHQAETGAGGCELCGKDPLDDQAADGGGQG
jgi:hypothetical protein